MRQIGRIWILSGWSRIGQILGCGVNHEGGGNVGDTNIRLNKVHSRRDSYQKVDFKEVVALCPH